MPGETRVLLCKLQDEGGRAVCASFVPSDESVVEHVRAPSALYDATTEGFAHVRTPSISNLTKRTMFSEPMQFGLSSVIMCPTRSTIHSSPPTNRR